MKAKGLELHKTKKIIGVPITKLQKKYGGTPGDKTILYHDCECGEKHAFEYGSTEHMREVYKDIQEKRLQHD